MSIKRPMTLNHPETLLLIVPIAVAFTVPTVAHADVHPKHFPPANNSWVCTPISAPTEHDPVIRFTVTVHNETLIIRHVHKSGQVTNPLENMEEVLLGRDPYLDWHAVFKPMNWNGIPKISSYSLHGNMASQDGKHFHYTEDLMSKVRGQADINDALTANCTLNN
jgi:hypothetical protein